MCTVIDMVAWTDQGERRQERRGNYEEGEAMPGPFSWKVPVPWAAFSPLPQLFSHTCTWALLVPSHHLFMCFRVHHTVSKPSLYIAFIFSIPTSGYMVGIQGMFVEEECLYDPRLLFSVQTNQIAQLTCKLFNLKFLCSYLMILLIILLFSYMQIYTYTYINMCVYMCAYLPKS